jgi:hypothetical protein
MMGNRRHRCREHSLVARFVIPIPVRVDLLLSLEEREKKQSKEDLSFEEALYGNPDNVLFLKTDHK